MISGIMVCLRFQAALYPLLGNVRSLESLFKVKQKPPLMVVFVLPYYLID